MRFKKMFIIAALLLVVILGIAWVVLVTYDVNRLKPRIAQLVKDATGRELTFNGYLDLKWGFPPVLTAENVSFANGPWGSRPELAKIKHLKAQVALLPLIRGHINFNELPWLSRTFF